MVCIKLNIPRRFAVCSAVRDALAHQGTADETSSMAPWTTQAVPSPAWGVKAIYI